MLQLPQWLAWPLVIALFVVLYFLGPQLLIFAFILLILALAYKLFPKEIQEYIRVWALFLCTPLLSIGFFIGSFWNPWFLLFIPLVVLPMGVCIIYFILAPPDYFFSFFKEGTSKTLVSGGALIAIIPQFAGYDLDDEGNVVPIGYKLNDRGSIIDAENNIIPREDVILKVAKRRRLFGGLRYIGLYPFVTVYGNWYSWNNIDYSVTPGGKLVPHIKEWLTYTLLKSDVHPVTITEAEDRNLLPLDIDIALTLRIINPRKATFEIQHLESAIREIIAPDIREVIAERSYEDWIRDSGAVMGKDIYLSLSGQRQKKDEQGNLVLNDEKQPIVIGEDLVGIVFKKYGVLIEMIQVRNIDPPAIYRKATIDPYLARQEAAAAIIKAEAEGKKRKLEGEGTAAAIAAQGTAYASAVDEIGKAIAPVLGASVRHVREGLEPPEKKEPEK